MKKEAAAVSKISSSRAEEEAERILFVISSQPDQAKETANEICKSYTLGPRREIVDVLARMLLRTKDAKPDPAVVKAFLETLTCGLVPLSAQKLIPSLVRVAWASSAEEGPKIGAALLLDLFQLGNEASTEVNSGSSDDGRLVAEITTLLDRPDRLLTALLDAATKRNMVTTRFLSIWARAQTAVLVRRASSGQSVGADEAASILRMLTPVSRKTIPDELLIAIPFLVACADAQENEAFRSSEIGMAVAQFASLTLHLDATPVTLASQKAPAGREEKSRDDGDRDRVLRELTALFARYDLDMANLRQSCEEKEVALREAARDFDHREEELRNLLAQAREERNTLRSRVRDLENEIEQLGREIATAREQEKKWRSEVEFKEREHTSRLQISASEIDERLRSQISKPVKNLRDHVLAVLKSNQENSKIRLMAAAFDALHRRLIDLTKHGSEDRIPRELFMSPEGETGGHGDKD
jgi:hypothetical protein